MAFVRSFGVEMGSFASAERGAGEAQGYVRELYNHNSTRRRAREAIACDESDRLKFEIREFARLPESPQGGNFRQIDAPHNNYLK